MSLRYDQLVTLFSLVLVYLFASVIVLQFMLIRKNDVKNYSYLLVFYGMLAMIIANRVFDLKFFYFNSLYINQAFIVVINSISHYLIVIGIVKKNKN